MPLIVVLPPPGPSIVEKLVIARTVEAAVVVTEALPLLQPVASSPSSVRLPSERAKTVGRMMLLRWLVWNMGFIVELSFPRENGYHPVRPLTGNMPGGFTNTG